MTSSSLTSHLRRQTEMTCVSHLIASKSTVMIPNRPGSMMGAPYFFDHPPCFFDPLLFLDPAYAPSGVQNSGKGGIKKQGRGLNIVGC